MIYFTAYFSHHECRQITFHMWPKKYVNAVPYVSSIYTSFIRTLCSFSKAHWTLWMRSYGAQIVSFVGYMSHITFVGGEDQGTFWRILTSTQLTNQLWSAASMSYCATSSLRLFFRMYYKKKIFYVTQQLAWRTFGFGQKFWSQNYINKSLRAKFCRTTLIT